MTTTTTIAIDTFVKETGGWIASQLEACTRCGICAEACHFYQATENPEYAPVWKIELLRRAYEQRFTAFGRVKLAMGIDKPITDEDLAHWSDLVYQACTVCNKCSLACPMGIQLGPLIHDVRAGLAEAGVVPQDLKDAVNKQVEEGSPLGVTDDLFEDRIDWIADEWEIDIPIDVEGADTLVIFSSIEIMKFPDNIGAIASIMETAGEKWTLSTAAREVVNFGFYEGSHSRTEQFLQKLFDGASALGVKRIVVTECGHAYDALRWTAANIMDVPDIEITHIASVLGEFVGNGRIKLQPGFFDNGTITFHDACKIQRRGGHIKEPREVLNILAPNSFKEMTPNSEESICCGGGGGVIAIKDADALRLETFKLKVDQVAKVGADTVALTCSNCRLQFLDGIQHHKAKFKVRGLSEMVAEALVEE
jgi:Fe-S oxidoreductase